MTRLAIEQYAAEIVVLYGTSEEMAAIARSGKVPLTTFRDFAEADNEIIYGATSDVCPGEGKVRRAVFVYVNSDQTPNEKRLTIVHEMFHAVVRLMADIGQTITPESDEASAYALEWATKRGWLACGLR